MHPAHTRGGFTLIELMVVIAIVALLSSVVLASLNNARSRARVAQAQSSMGAIQKAAVLCMNAGTALNSPVVGTAVCTGEAAYPTLPTNGTWTYPTSGTPCRNAAGAAAAVDTTVTDSTFLFCATGDSKIVSCHETGCRTD